MTDRELSGAACSWRRIIGACAAAAALAASVVGCDKPPPLDQERLNAQDCVQPGNSDPRPPGPDLLKRFEMKRSAESAENRDFINAMEGLCAGQLYRVCIDVPDRPEPAQREVCTAWREFAAFMAARQIPLPEYCEVCHQLGLWPRPVPKTSAAH